MFNWIKNLFGGGASTDYAALLRDGATIIDVRSAQEFSSGNIVGSQNISLQELPTRIAKLDKNKTYIMCCASGMRSAAAKQLLQKNGFTNTYNGGGWYSLLNKITA